MSKSITRILETSYLPLITLFYCDPSYFQARPGYYPGSFSMKDHEDLAKLLNNVKGKVCLSYYPHPKVDELYPDWRRDQKEVVAFSALTRGGKKKPKRVELLLMNYWRALRFRKRDLQRQIAYLKGRMQRFFPNN